jgi:hypothetical protein
MWHTPITNTLKRLSWKPHDAPNFAEVIPQLGGLFNNLSALYDPATDNVVIVWDDGTAIKGNRDGSLYSARFNPTTGALVSGPVTLFPGSDPRLAHRQGQGGDWLLYYRTARNGGVYGRVSKDGGLTWQSGYPLINGKVSDTQSIEVVSFSSQNASIAQLGTETRKLTEAFTLLRTRPLTSIVKHPTLPNQFFLGEPSKFDNVTLTDNLRGALVLSTDNTKLYHLDGVQQGTSDGIGAVSKMTVTGIFPSIVASAGPTGNGDDLNEYTLTPTAGTLNVDLPGTSYAVSLGVSASYGYVAQYADNSSTAGQFVVVNLSTGATATVLAGIQGVRAIAVANFLSPALIFVATTEAGVERLRVYQENALSPTLLLNTKLTSRANALTVAVDPANPSGALVYASLTDRFNIYKYTNPSTPLILFDTITLPGGGTFFQSQIASNGNIVVACGNAGVMVLDPNGKTLAQVTLSGKVVEQWKPQTAYALNALVRPRDVHQFAKSRYYFKATTAGTSGKSEPLWAASGTVSDNTAAWQAVGVVDGYATGIAIDEDTKRIYAVGTAGGPLGTDGRMWLITASGLL